MADLALANGGALEPALLHRAMIDDAPEHPPAAIEIDAKPAADKSTSDAGTAGATPAKRKRKPSAKSEIEAIETRLGYVFVNKALLANALTHVSALKSGRGRTDSYQRLEFLGDHVLGLVVSDMLFRAFPTAQEGELSKRLADLVRRESCADVAKSLELVDAIKLGQMGGGASSKLRNSVLGDICEAVIGAVFLDGGYGAAEQFVERNWMERMRRPKPLRDAKTVLQEWAQGQGLPTPSYREVERTGPHHDPQFRIAVNLKGREPAEGTGGSKRVAERNAAMAMLAREGVTL